MDPSEIANAKELQESAFRMKDEELRICDDSLSAASQDLTECESSTFTSISNSFRSNPKEASSHFLLAYCEQDWNTVYEYIELRHHKGIDIMMRHRTLFITAIRRHHDEFLLCLLKAADDDGLLESLFKDAALFSNAIHHGSDPTMLILCELPFCRDLIQYTSYGRVFLIMALLAENQLACFCLLDILRGGRGAPHLATDNPLEWPLSSHHENLLPSPTSPPPSPSPPSPSPPPKRSVKVHEALLAVTRCEQWLGTLHHIMVFNKILYENVRERRVTEQPLLGITTDDSNSVLSPLSISSTHFDFNEDISDLMDL